ncbi:MAG: hypothetical protein RLP08_24825 [Marinovum algicola]|jgi:hypothetical protein|uniref:hypothetical protein n=1 Tax=Marinovum algicola TaxID=42444 RepID=UPI0032ECE171
MTEFEPGDVVEIKTDQGLAYAQVTQRHASYPTVVRALEGTYDSRPDDIAGLVAGGTSFVAMIPLASALPQAGAACEVVARLEVPEAHQAFPTFRMPIRDKAGEIVYWWFWDGRSLSFEVELDRNQSSLPIREVMTGDRFLYLLRAQES